MLFRNTLLRTPGKWLQRRCCDRLHQSSSLPALDQEYNRIGWAGSNFYLHDSLILIDDSCPAGFRVSRGSVKGRGYSWHDGKVYKHVRCWNVTLYAHCTIYYWHMFKITMQVIHTRIVVRKVMNSLSLTRTWKPAAVCARRTKGVAPLSGVKQTKCATCTGHPDCQDFHHQCIGQCHF